MNILHRLRALFRKEELNQELSEELAFHLDKQVEQNIAAGMSAEDARCAALRSFGGVEQVKEECRDAWSVRFVDNLLRDIRFGLRMLAKNPGFTAVAVLSFGLGIGANTAIFSVVNAALLRPLPYRHSGQLVMVWEQLPALGLDRFASPFANYFDYQSQNHVFDDIAAIDEAQFDFTGGDRPDRIFGMRTSANLFPLLGIAPALGRSFTPDENRPGHANVAVLSDSFWRRLGADRSVLGKEIFLDGNPFTVVGVMPRDFRFSIGSADLPQVWLPIAFEGDPDRNRGRLQLLARLKPGVSLEQARTEMKTIAGRLEQQYHLYRGPNGEDAGYTVAVFPLQHEITGDMHLSLLLMLGAVASLLLIACVNMANLLLARGATREKEVAVRAALGASQARLVRQLLTEGVTLALIGGTLGLLLAFCGVARLVALSPYHILRVLHVGIDGRVLGFTLLVSLFTGVLFALPPAMLGSRADLNQSLKQGAVVNRGMTNFPIRLRNVLVVAEVALSLLLMVVAGLTIRSFAAVQSVNPGFQPEKVMTTRVTLPATEYGDSRKRSAFFGQLVERVSALPGVISAAAISSLPLAGGAHRDPFSIEGRSWHQADPSTGTPQVASFEVISQGYFHTLQIPWLAGRDFSSSDINGALPVAIINATMAHGFWPGSSPLGKRIVLGAPRPEAAWLTIVGVAGDVRNAGLETEPWPQIYVPLMQRPSPSMTLVIRTAHDPGEFATVVQREVMALDRDRPVYGTATLDQLLAETVAPRRYNMILLGTLAALALGLSSIGIYGVISFWVTRRTHEFGIRLALGAYRNKVVRMVIGEGMLLALVGVALGLCGAWFLARIMVSMLYGVRPEDPPTFLAMALLQSGVAWLACYLPARRATRVDPMVALRYE